MTFSKSGNIDRIKYKLTNNEIEHVREYKYLGFVFTTNGSMANGINRLTKRPKGERHGLLSKNMSEALNRKIYTSG